MRLKISSFVSNDPSVFRQLLKSRRDFSLRGLADGKLVLLLRDPSTRPAVQEELLCRHAGMLHQISRRMHARAGGGAELCDYEAQAILGAYSSYDRFDPGKGVRLSTFTYSTVVRFIVDSQRRETFENGVRPPPSMAKHRQYLLGDYDPYPLFKRAYEERNGLTPEVVRALESHPLYALIYGVESLEALEADNKDAPDLRVIDNIPDPRCPTDDDIVDMAMLQQAVASLGGDKERAVAQMLLLERHSVDHVASETGLSAQQVRRYLYRSGKKLGKIVSGDAKISLKGKRESAADLALEERRDETV